MAIKKAIETNGRGVKMCHHFAPAIINIRKPKSDTSAAVPKSSVIIKPATRPTAKQAGTNLFQYNFRLALKLSQKAARKKTSTHFASSDG